MAQFKTTEVQPFGVILAGGLARRMGGGDKALQEIAGETALARLARRLAPQCAGLALNANGDAARFAAFGLPVVADDVPDFAGPLAGVLAGLEFFAREAGEAALAVTVPGDTPFAPQDLVARLTQAQAEAGAEIAVAVSGGRVHHAVALWPVSLRGALRRALVDEDVRAVSGFIARHSSVAVDWPVEPYDPFFNVNRPEDVKTAEEIAKFA